MSFAKLKATRDANARPSYVASDVPETSHRAAEESRAVQASEDALYRSIPRSTLEIRKDSDKERGLWAKRNLGAGHTILALPPYASALSTSNLATHCSLCTRPGACKRCPQCQIVHYCDSTCQTADWALHKLECAALRRCMAPPSSSEQEAGIPNDAIRCLARGMWRRRKKGFVSDWAREMDAMQAHPPASPATHEQHTHLALSLVRFLGLTSPQELVEYGIQSGAELAQIVAKFTTNTFTLSSPDLTPLGACVSPPVALINHSCQPNAVVVFPGRKSGGKEPIMQVVAIRPIGEGEEILTAYIDTTLPTELRRQALKETYSFDCDCSLCREAEAADPRASVWCPKRCGGLCRMPTDENPLSRCSTCGTVLRDTDAVLDATRVGQQGLDKATSVQFTDPRKARQLTTNLIPILASAGLPPSAHPLLALRRLHLAMLIEDLSLSASASPTSTPEQTQTALDEAIVTATQVCGGLDPILFPGHPVCALARAELGKLLAVDEPAPATSAPQKYPPSGPARLRTALETLLAARDELWVGFGVANEGGEVGNAVREDIVRLEKEMAVWKRGVGDAMKDAGLSLAGRNLH